MVSKCRLLFKKIKRKIMSEVVKKKETKEIKYKIEIERATSIEAINVVNAVISTKNDSYKRHISISEYITGNCQICAIGFLNNLILSPLRPSDEEEAIVFEDTIISKLKLYSKRQVIIDIEEEYEEDLVKILKRNSDNYHEMFRQPYQNGTGTDMIMIMFKWDEYDYDEEHPNYDYSEEDDDY